MATKRGRPPKPKITWRDFLTEDERSDMRWIEREIKERALALAIFREKRRRIMQRAAAEMRRSGA